MISPPYAAIHSCLVHSSARATLTATLRASSTPPGVRVMVSVQALAPPTEGRAGAPAVRRGAVWLSLSLESEKVSS